MSEFNHESEYPESEVDGLVRRAPQPEALSTEARLAIWRQVQTRLATLATASLRQTQSKGTGLMINKPKSRFAQITRWAAVAAIIAIIAIALFDLGGTNGSKTTAFASIIERTAASFLTATVERIDEGGQVTDTAELYYDGSRLVRYENDKPVYLNDGTKTWQLDQTPISVRHETAQERLASEIGLNADFIMQVLGSNDEYFRLAEMPDSTYEGRTVKVWQVQPTGKREEMTTTMEFLVDESTGRLAQSRFWDKPKGASEPVLKAQITVDYDTPIPPAVFDVELPSPSEVNDLSQAQEQLTVGAITLVDEPGLKAELTNLMVGPGGEIIGCITSRCEKKPPVIVSVLLNREGGPSCNSVSLGMTMQPGLHRAWTCWVPWDLDAYLVQAGQADAMVGQPYKANVIYAGKHQTVSVQPGAAFTAWDYQAKIAQPMRASGISESAVPDLYTDLQERIAQMSAWQAWQYRPPNTPVAERYLRWLVYYQQLADKHGHGEAFAETIDGLLKAIERNKGDFPDLAPLLLDATRLIGDRHAADSALSYEELLTQMPQIQGR